MLLERVALAVERLFDDETQKRRKTIGAGENLAREDHARAGPGLERLAGRRSEPLSVVDAWIAIDAEISRLDPQNLTFNASCNWRMGVKGMRLEIVPALAEPMVVAGLANTG